MTRNQRGLLIVAAVVLAFLGGFAWQYVRAEALEADLADARRELTFARLETTIGAAAVQAHRGDFEAARRLTSEFYTGLQANVERAPNEAREDLTSILDRRDVLITSLSRAEPEGRESLTSTYLRYRIALGGPDRALPVSTPADAEDAAPTTPETESESPQSP